MRKIFTLRPKTSRYEWHDWFAWYPLYIDNDEVRGLVWLEVVRRCRRDNFAGSRWEYELVG